MRAKYADKINKNIFRIRELTPICITSGIPQKKLQSRRQCIKLFFIIFSI